MLGQGVYTNAAVEFGTIMGSPAWSVWSTALLLMLVVIWVTNSVLTIKGLWAGTILG